ncbi:MAG TPA: ATP-binding protein [Sphingomonas sp.]|nr:ATP-binding protein [Sphingomonas sp.]
MRRLARAIFSFSLVLSCAGAAAQSPAKADGFQARVAAIHAKLISDPKEALSEAEGLPKLLPAGADAAEATLYLLTSNWLRAESLISLNEPKKAMALVSESMPKTLRYFAGTPLQGKLLMARGGAAAMLGDVPSALSDYQTAFRVFGRTRELRGQAVALQSIAQIYVDAGDFESVIKYEQQSIDVYSLDPMLLISAHNNNGIAYFGLGKYARAEREYQLAYGVARELDSPLLAVRILQNIASAQAQLGKLDEAERTLARAFPLTLSGSAASRRPALYAVEALIELKRRHLDKAASLISRTFAETDDTQAAIPMRDIHHTAYEIYRQLGQSGKALQHLEAFKRLDDEARALAASTSAALMNARFKFANQENKISELRVDQAEAQVRFHNTLTQGLLSVAAIISTMLLIGFLSIRRSRNQVREANASLTTTNVALEKALTAKTEFLATTSHEIRTPLNGILGMTQVILAGRSLDPSLRSRIELVHGAGETMKALVDDILDVAKMETGELRIQKGEMDLKRLLGDAVQVWTGQAETKRIGIEFELEDCPAKIIADEVRLRQVIFNLMSNAIKFTDRGQVRLTSLAQDGEDERGERLIIRIADSGIGIPKDRLEDIFESFQQVDGGVTRRHGGTGLGLAICRSLARAMGGDVTVSSMLGAGSTFTLDLPLERGAVETASADRPAPTSLREAELLMIEPNPLGQGIMRALLGGECGGIQFAIDVAGGLEILAASGVDHVIAEGSALGLDPAGAGELARTCASGGARFTLLWRDPDHALLAALAEQGVGHVVAKPISAPDLLTELNRVYGEVVASRDIAA